MSTSAETIPDGAERYADLTDNELVDLLAHNIPAGEIWKPRVFIISESDGWYWRDKESSDKGGPYPNEHVAILAACAFHQPEIEEDDEIDGASRVAAAKLATWDTITSALARTLDAFRDACETHIYDPGTDQHPADCPYCAAMAEAAAAVKIAEAAQVGEMPAKVVRASESGAPDTQP